MSATQTAEKPKSVNLRSKEAMGVPDGYTIVQIPLVLEDKFRSDLLKLARNEPKFVDKNGTERSLTLFEYISKNLGVEKFLTDQTETLTIEADKIVSETPVSTPKSPEEAKKTLDKLMARAAKLQEYLKAGDTDED